MRKLKLTTMILVGLMACSSVVGATPVEETEGVVTLTTAMDTKLRTANDAEAEIIGFLPLDTEVVAIQRVGNWYEVEIEEVTGYIYKSQIDESVLADLPEATVAQSSYLGEEVVAYAKQFLGNPYVYGGNSLTNGVDCSGFTSQIYKNLGVSLQRSSRSQYASNGYSVSEANILPGDLVFYGNGGVINHVAIYAGNGQIIHASTERTGITMSNLRYGKPIIGIKRVI